MKLDVLYASLLCCNGVLASSVTLYAKDVLEDDQRKPITQFEFDSNTRTFVNNEDSEQVYDTSGLISGKLYCFGVDSDDASESIGKDDCITFLELKLPLSYELIYNNDINKMSFVYDETLANKSDVIVASVTNSTKSQIADVVQLRKKTKTYADKKKEANDVNVASEKGDGKKLGKDSKVDEELGKPWIQENWKKVVIGLIIYNVFMVLTKGAERKEEKTE